MKNIITAIGIGGGVLYTLYVIVFLFMMPSVVPVGGNSDESVKEVPSQVTVDQKNMTITEWYTSSLKAKIFIIRKNEIGNIVGEVKTVNFVPR